VRPGKKRRGERDERKGRHPEDSPQAPGERLPEDQHPCGDRQGIRQQHRKTDRGERVTALEAEL
jgi:hypothetical protein